MDLGLDCRTALVTGASLGIGLACARTLLEEGARVAVSSSSAARTAAAAGELAAEHGARVAGIVLDLTDAAAPARAVAEVAARFDQPPTLFVSSTGGPPPGTFDELDEQAWERAADLVLRGFIRSVKALLPGMRAARHGRIVAVTSIAAVEPIVSLTTSSTLRAGLHGFVNVLSRQVGGDGITVNALMPGYTRTARLEEVADRLAAGRGTTRAAELEGLVAETPLGRLVEPSELGAAAAFLCSDRAAAISGQALSVDGGRLLGI